MVRDDIVSSEGWSSSIACGYSMCSYIQTLSVLPALSVSVLNRISALKTW